MALVNNIPHTTYTVNEDPFDGVTLTVTCDDGYTFDGTPTIDYQDNVFGDTHENVKLKVSSDGTVATITDEEIDSDTIVINGNVTGGSSEPVPQITNNVPQSTESYEIADGVCTVKVTSDRQDKALRNIKCSYTSVDGGAKEIVCPVTYTVNDGYKVNSFATCDLSDLDYSKDITLTGENIYCYAVNQTLSGCSSDFDGVIAFVGDTITVTLTADTGNEFTDPLKVYFENDNAFGSSNQTYLTISDDKKTATGSYKVEDGDEEIKIIGEAQQAESPVKKYGFINAYVVSEQNLEDFATKRFVAYTGQSGTDADPINYDLGDYVNRVKRYFFEVEKGSSSKLNCGNFVVDTDVFNLAADVKRISFGTVDVPNFTESAADYIADVLLFVPFVGVVSVDSEIIGQTVELTLSVNLLSGGGVYTLTCDGRIVWTQEVKPCTDVIYRTSAQDVKTIGGTNFDSSYLMGLKPYLILNRKQLQNNGAQVATERFITIGDLTGYNKVTDVQLTSTVNMLQEDVDEITQILRTGFAL